MVYVTSILRPAAFPASLECGDEICSINGVPLARLSRAEVAHLLAELPVRANQASERGRAGRHRHHRTEPHARCQGSEARVVFAKLPPTPALVAKRIQMEVGLRKFKRTLASKARARFVRGQGGTAADGPPRDRPPRGCSPCLVPRWPPSRRTPKVRAATNAGLSSRAPCRIIHFTRGPPARRL